MQWSVRKSSTYHRNLITTVGSASKMSTALADLISLNTAYFIYIERERVRERERDYKCLFFGFSRISQYKYPSEPYLINPIPPCVKKL